MEINKDLMQSLENASEITTITTKATESHEEFIFETITPFIEDNIKVKINKRELIEALLLYRTFKEKVEAYYGNQSNSNI